VELLVVVAIIALLAALLLPAFGRMRHMALATLCATQLRQLGAAMVVYAGDHEGVLPMNDNATATPTPNVSWDDRLSGYDGRERLTEQQMNIDGLSTAHTPNFPLRRNIYKCPAESWVDPHDEERYVRSYSVPRNHGVWSVAEGGDGLPRGLYGSADGEYFRARLGQVPIPSKTLLLVELRQSWMGLGSLSGWAVDTPMPFAFASQLWNSSWPAPMQVPLHNPSWNYLSVDGSVALIEPMNLVADPTIRYWSRVPPQP